MKNLRKCANCRSWTALQPDDPTAGEGRCSIERTEWKGPLFICKPDGTIQGTAFAYHPATLRHDHCGQHRFAKAEVAA